MSHEQSSNWLFKRFYAIITKEGQGIFTLIFFIDLFVKEAYYVAKILHKYNFFIIFIISLKENIFFVKLCKISFDSDILASLTEFQCQDTDTFGSIWVKAF